ncbi:hypothetical protein QWY15_12835 [Planococcus sp. N064]|uniref:Uncharacterized protein n=1 Tax=Planococcus liqunii TaxID=3058394 RepID=A0ABT8MTF4_9BACL|nr:hypothetical protein [Planococcus sp. N064]MDN7228185.1 hypothetical protein [Planococcus sp. N064]
MEEYLVLQIKLKHYCFYVKNLIASLSGELDRDSVHIRRITVILDRLLANESESFKLFFNDEKKTLSMQLIDYITCSGEILHVGSGYYLLPPERTISLKNGQYVGVSMLKVDGNDFMGIGNLLSEQLARDLEVDQYFHRPVFKHLLSTYEKKLAPLQGPSETLEFDEYRFFTKERMYRTKKFTSAKEDKYYLLKANRVFNNGSKPEKFLAIVKNEQWFLSSLNSNSHYYRLLIGLSSKAGKYQNYKIKILNQSYSELYLPYFLPNEEHFILRLIALPEHYKWPKKYTFMNEHTLFIEEILEQCGLKKEGN